MACHVLPYRACHSWYCLISAAATEGLAFFRLQRNWSMLNGYRSCGELSKAKISCGDLPAINLLTPSIAQSRHRLWISAPLKPSVISESSLRDTSLQTTKTFKNRQVLICKPVSVHTCTFNARLPNTHVNARTHKPKCINYAVSCESLVNIRKISSLASWFGSGTYIRFSNRRRNASSKSQGRFVVARTMTLLLLQGFVMADVRPSTWLRISLFIRREASCSELPPLVLARASTSSRKTIEGACARAMLNSVCTNFSDSPLHLDMMLAIVTLKNVNPAEPATAFASMVLPVPGGPCKRIPLHGCLKPVKNSGSNIGRSMLSFKMRFAPSRAAMSSKVNPTLVSITLLRIAWTAAGSKPFNPFSRLSW
mmetsp:Transcript_51053/g.100073  ORF Transcript_51053/g.100073 Transcript_51053/m.100073 type:complete len:367 (+) Transcript_51053:163-1263(+)